MLTAIIRKDDLNQEEQNKIGHKADNITCSMTLKGIHTLQAIPMTFAKKRSRG